MKLVTVILGFSLYFASALKFDAPKSHLTLRQHEQPNNGQNQWGNYPYEEQSTEENGSQGNNLNNQGHKWGNNDDSSD